MDMKSGLGQDYMMKNKKRILVVDDEPGILALVDTILGLAGYDVVTTQSGEEALALVRSDEPDLVLLDIVMVPVTGFDVLDRLRTFSRVPVIVFTAQSAIAEKAQKFGANDWIAKPFNPDVLLEKIQHLLDQHGADRVAPDL